MWLAADIEELEQEEKGKKCDMRLSILVSSFTYIKGHILHKIASELFNFAF